MHKCTIIDNLFPPVSSIGTWIFINEVENCVNIFLGSKSGNTLLTGIVSCQIFISDVICGIKHMRTFPRCLPTDISIITNLRFVFKATWFSCNDNNSVCSTRTINSSYRSILMNGYWLNIIRIQIINTGLRKTIYYIQRGCRTCNRTNTTDMGNTSRTRSTTAGSNSQTGNFTLKNIINATYRHIF